MPRWPRLVDSADPISYLRVAVGLLLVGATLVAVGLAVTGIAPRAILLIGLLWGIYGLFYALVDGLLEPLIDFAARALTDAGLARRSEGFSDVEAMVSQGHLELAAGICGERAREKGSAEAAIRQARLLAGPLRNPGRAMVELRRFLEQHPRARGIRQVSAELAALKHSPEL